MAVLQLDTNAISVWFRHAAFFNTVFFSVWKYFWAINEKVWVKIVNNQVILKRYHTAHQSSVETGRVSKIEWYANCSEIKLSLFWCSQRSSF